MFGVWRGEKGKDRRGEDTGKLRYGGRPLRYACDGSVEDEREIKGYAKGYTLCKAPQGAAWGVKLFDSLVSQRMNGDAQEHSGSMKRSMGANASALS